MKILDGKLLANEISKDLKGQFAALEIKPKFIIFQVGNDEASNIYINFKLQKAKELGIDAKVINFPEDIEQQDLIEKIEMNTEAADAAIVQLPLPLHIDKQMILNSIPFEKDIDGLAEHNTMITPATPRGIMLLLKENKVKIKGVSVGVVGQSNLVGKPVSLLCEEAGAKVSRYDKESGIKGTEKHDVLIVAAGQANLIKKTNIKEGVTIIDVGINEIADENAMKTGIVGDVDRKSVGQLPAAMSPVPGGVGPMTVISLFLNLYDVVKKLALKA